MISRLPLPRSRVDAAQFDLPAGTLRELEYLTLSPEQWAQFDQMHDGSGIPLIAFKDDGSLVINDPLLAQWDAEARRNAAAGDAG